MKQESTPKEVSKLDNAIIGQSEQLNVLSDLFGLLENRLRPVLTEQLSLDNLSTGIRENGDLNPQPPLEADSPVVNSIRSNTSKVSLLAHSMNVLLKNLEV
jgi:hypothetical protein